MNDLMWSDLLRSFRSSFEANQDNFKQEQEINPIQAAFYEGKYLAYEQAEILLFNVLKTKKILGEDALQPQLETGPKEHYWTTRKFNYDEVKKILCEGCSLNLGSVTSSDSPERHYHTLNGERVPCLASRWKDRAGQLLLIEERELNKDVE